MTAPERGPHGGPARVDLIKKLKDIIGMIFQSKAEREIRKRAEEGEKAHREREGQETRQKREEEKERQAEKEKERAYHEARSAEVAEETAQVARDRRAAEVIGKLIEKVNNPGERPPGSDYFISEIDPRIQTALAELINASPSAAEVVNNFLTEGTELHGSAKELLKQAQRLSYEANKVPNKLNELQPIFAAISDRAQKLLWEELEVSQRVAKKRGIQGPFNIAELLAQDTGIVLTENEEKDLSRTEQVEGKYNEEATRRKWEQAIDKVIMTPRTADSAKAAWATSVATPVDQTVVDKLEAPINKIWGEIERLESTGDKPISAEELAKFDRRIREAETGVYPKDVQPRTDAYNQIVQQAKKDTETKLNALAEKLKVRLREELPAVKEGIVDEEKFLLEVVRSKGHLGHLFELNPVMQERFFGLGEPSGRFRNRVFLKIHSSVLLDQRNASHDNFGLYERADFTSFIDLLRTGLEKYKLPESGESLGQTWADYYNNLSNAIRQSRDIDFWASQPAGNIENFNKSLGMFQNEYTYHAMSIPAVAAAFRAYETTLESIKASCDGYLPPGLIEYNAVRKGAFWDQRSRTMLEQMISMGGVPDLYRDEHTYLDAVDQDGHSLKLKTDNDGKVLPLDVNSLSPDEIQMYMVLAKGVGMASARYLEIIAQSRVPGSDQPEIGMKQFHSMAYEGLAKALNYFNVYVEKWKMGSYKYFFLLNQLIPEEKRIKTDGNDPGEAIRAFMAYQDGTFEKIYGKDAKRFIDSTNFSGISSAIGKDTLWRQYDSTYRWSDKQKELLGGGTLIALSERYAGEKVKDLLVESKYREIYRQELVKRNNEQSGLNLATSGAAFDKLWEEYGRSKYDRDIEREWDRLNGKHPAKGKEHTALAEKTHLRIEAYQTALKTRVWVQMAMRNPLGVARNLKIDMPLVGLSEGEKQIKLHNLLVQEVLGIPPEDTKFSEVHGWAGFGKTPDTKQTKYIEEVLQLEGDLAAVREKAITFGRDLTEQDFREVIKDEARRSHALNYWGKVKQVILGTESAEDLYDQFGLAIAENGEDYEWNDHSIHGIHGIEDTLKKLEGKYGKRVTTITGTDGREISIPFLLKSAVESKQEWILGTDDMAISKMDWLNLGSRHWIRRGGDIASHQAGGDQVVAYLMQGLHPTPDKKDLAELLTKVRDAYSADMIEVGWNVGANLAYLTDRLYSWDWGRLGSVAQTDVWHTRRGVAAWLANGRREFWDALEHADVLPPHSHFYYYGTDVRGEKTDIHTLRKMCHATNIDVWKEIIALGALLAIAITIYRGLSAPSEEEESGGGGHH